MTTINITNQLDPRLFESFDDPQKRKEAKAVIADALREAQNDIRNGLRASLPSDPRGAYKAVKRTAYKSILGGNISILDRRTGTASVGVGESTPRRSSSGIRRRRPVSERTKQIDSYRGADRAFILRFLNNGTTARVTRFGNRGSIAARNLFEPVAARAMARAEAVISARLTTPGA